MSMLSVQADELRTLANELDERERHMDAYVQAMREAADTIISLRDRLQESYGQVPEQDEREDDGERESCSEDNSCAECAEDMGRYADSLCDPLKQHIAELEEQRDVLLRCLENDYGLRASWDGLRRVWLTESVTAELDYIEDKSRWFELFGMPERAARTLVYVLGCKDSRPWVSCEECPILDGCKTRSGGYDALLEWLRGDAE